MSSQTIFVTKGATSQSRDVGPILQNTGATSPGDALTGLADNTASLTAYYRRGATGSATAISLAPQTVTGAYSSGGFVEISSTTAPGMYRLDIPNAVLASGVDSAVITLTGAASMATHTIHIVLTSVDLYDSVRGGMTALPNAAANAAGGLLVSTAGSLDMDSVLSGNTPQTGDSYARLGAPSGASVSADIAGVAPGVWDQATSSHVAAGSFGATNQGVASGTAQSGGATSITLAAAASATNDFYTNDYIYILSGTGAGQGRFITAYDGTTKAATVNTWITNPDATSVYQIIPFDSLPGASAPTAAQNAAAVWDLAMSGHSTDGTFGQLMSSMVVATGTAQAGGSSSITLAAGSSATNDLYKYDNITILSGTGEGQQRQISGYTGSSKVATVSLSWTVQPDATSVYLIAPFGIDAATVAAITGGVWDVPRSSHVTSGTFGEYVPANAARIAGSSTAASNASAAFSTGYGFTGCTMPTVTTLTGHTPQTGDSYARLGAPAGVSVSADIAAAQTDITTIVDDTHTSGVASVQGNVAGSVGSLATQAKADVKTEVVAALDTDTYAEPGQGAPAATASLVAKLGYLYKAWRNKSTETGSQYSLYDDAGTTVDQKATVSDDGTTATKGEIGTGP